MIKFKSSIKKPCDLKGELLPLKYGVKFVLP